MSPKRIQRKRTAGWRMPEGAVYVGRPTKWGNPYAPGYTYSSPEFIVGRIIHNRLDAVEAFSEWIAGSFRVFHLQARRVHILKSLHELAGKDLACWCPLNEPCHASVLLEIANA